MEHLRNHSGERSVLVLRPADADETTVAWKMALENSSTPTALLLSRQGIKSLSPLPGSTRLTDAGNATKGAYIVRKVEGTPDVILVASGSEVATLMGGALLLEERKGLKVQIVSCISEGLFRDQDQAYQKEVIPSDIPVIGLTAGLPVTLAGLVGSKGMVIGLDTFGFSAPFKVLDEKLGFTAENVFEKVTGFLNM